MAGDPRYPDNAREAKISGVVVIQALVRADGVPDQIVILRMPEGGEWLAGAAIQAISQWRYEPARCDGVPHDVYLSIIVSFELQ